MAIWDLLNQNKLFECPNFWSALEFEVSLSRGRKKVNVCLHMHVCMFYVYFPPFLLVTTTYWRWSFISSHGTDFFSLMDQFWNSSTSSRRFKEKKTRPKKKKPWCSYHWMLKLVHRNAVDWIGNLSGFFEKMIWCSFYLDKFFDLSSECDKQLFHRSYIILL